MLARAIVAVIVGATDFFGKTSEDIGQLFEFVVFDVERDVSGVTVGDVGHGTSLWGEWKF